MQAFMILLAFTVIIVAGAISVGMYLGAWERNEHGFPASRRLYRNKKRAGR